MKRNAKKIILNIIGLIFILFIFSCDNKSKNINNVESNINVSEKKDSKDTISYIDYVFGSYSMSIPSNYVENTKTLDSVVLLVDRIPVIMNVVQLNDEYTKDKIEEFERNLYQGFTGRFSRLVSEKVEEVNLQNTKGMMSQYVGFVGENEFIQKTYLFCDDKDKSIYMFTIFCLNNGINNKYLEEFENIIKSLKKIN